MENNPNQIIVSETQNEQKTWDRNIPIIQFVILVITFLGALFFGFSWDSPNPMLDLVAPIVILAFILTSILSLYYFKSLFKSRFNIKNSIIFIVTLVVPVLLAMFIPTSINNLKESIIKYKKYQEVKSVIKSKNEFSSDRLTEVNQKFTKPLVVKNFGFVSERQDIFAPFFIKLSDGSVVIPLLKNGKATEDEALQNLNYLMDKEVTVKLAAINIPIHKNSSPLYLIGDINDGKIFTPNEYYFVDIFLKDKQIDVLDENFLSNFSIKKNSLVFRGDVSLNLNQHSQLSGSGSSDFYEWKMLDGGINDDDISFKAKSIKPKDTLNNEIIFIGKINLDGSMGGIWKDQYMGRYRSGKWTTENNNAQRTNYKWDVSGNYIFRYSLD